MQKIILVLLIFALLGCAAQSKTSNSSDQSSSTSYVKDKFNNLKDSGEKLLSRSGEKNTIIQDLPSSFHISAYSIGADKDVLRHRADSYGLVDSKDLSNYLSGIRSRLVASSGMAGIPGNAFIDASLEIGATSSADGNVYLNWGFLKNFSYEDDVAALLAHELAHVMLGHHDSNALLDYNRKAQWFQGKGILISAIARNKNNGSINIKDSEVAQLQKLQLLVNLNSSVISSSWQRTQEREADLLAVDLLVKSGYNPDGVINMLSILKQNEEYTSTKPDQKVMLENAINLAVNEDNISKAQSVINILEPFLGTNHGDAETRIKDVSKYLRKYYSDSSSSPPYKKDKWEKVTSNSKLKKIITAYDGAFAAEKQFQAGNIKEAYHLSNVTIGTQKNQSYPTYIYSTTLEALYRSKEADNLLTQSLTAQEVSGPVYQKLAYKYSAKGNNKKALELIKDAHSKFSEPPTFMPDLIRYSRLSGDMKEARSLADSCSIKHTEYKDDCLKALEN